MSFTEAQSAMLPNQNQVQSQRLAGQVVLITGAGGSIGMETASRLLQEGASLSLVDISSEALDVAKSKLQSLLSSSDSADARILTIRADVTSEKEIEQFTKSTVDKFGRFDCASLNAGISYSSTSIFYTTEESYDRIMNVNVKSESKFALRGLALTAASELGQYGIRVNTIHPSGVDTPMFRATWSEEKLEELGRNMPLGRFAQVDDISGVVAFLASNDSKFMTGGFLKIDGGCVSF
ncbi:hypothetical protein LQW54_013048 [Pestalotiopsis sp. IQ-011]